MDAMERIANALEAIAGNGKSRQGFQKRRGDRKPVRCVFINGDHETPWFELGDTTDGGSAPVSLIQAESFVGQLVKIDVRERSHRGKTSLKVRPWLETDDEIVIFDLGFLTVDGYARKQAGQPLRYTQDGKDTVCAGRCLVAALHAMQGDLQGRKIEIIPQRAEQSEKTIMIAIAEGGQQVITGKHSEIDFVEAMRDVMRRVNHSNEPNGGQSQPQGDNTPKTPQRQTQSQSDTTRQTNGEQEHTMGALNRELLAAMIPERCNELWDWFSGEVAKGYIDNDAVAQAEAWYESALLRVNALPNTRPVDDEEIIPPTKQAQAEATLAQADSSASPTPP